MTKENYTHLSILVDRSGSMASIQSDAQGGLNNLVKEQAELDAGDITISLYEFDNDFSKVYGPIDAKEAPPYTLVPRGSTALLDAMVRSVNDTGKFLRDLPENQRPSKVLFAVVTDGHENASQEATPESVKKLVETQTDQWNWEFIYLGANVNAFAEASKYGIGTYTQYHGTAASAMGNYANLSRSISSTRTTGGAVLDFLATETDASGSSSSS